MGRIMGAGFRYILMGRMGRVEPLSMIQGESRKGGLVWYSISIGAKQTGTDNLTVPFRVP